MASVLLLFGGRSSEHEVSCESARSVHDALVGAGHRVIPVGIDRDGRWHLVDASHRPLRAEGRPVSLRVPEGVLAVADERIGFDVVFPVLHGPMGEDGTVQGLFDICDAPYVGCDVRASAVCMDKDLTKRLVAGEGIATPRWRTVTRRMWDEDPGGTIDAIASALPFPMFVKPSAQGSSVGISKVSDADSLSAGILLALRYDSKVVVEEAIVGREIEVAVLDGPRASLPGEILLEADWYTYDAKYADDSSECVAPAGLPDDQTLEVRSIAEAVFSLLGLSGLARIDFFLDATTGKFLFNEANTMPGFTSISGFPKMWLASGLTYEGLCSHLIDAAIEAHAQRSTLAIR
ncbi:MAG: D-alanine--D-alanine ligase family protein [Acidimicrobiia bacterium]